MRRYLATLVLMPALLGSSTEALADYQPILSAYVYGNQLSSSAKGAAAPGDSSGTGIGLGLTFDGGGSERFGLDYTEVDWQDSSDRLQLLNLNIDHFFAVPGVPPEARVFFGAAVGVGRLDLGGETGGTTDTRPDIGLRLGGNLRLNQQLSLEMGGRYLYNGLKARGNGGEFDVTAVRTIWAGLDWHF